MRKILTLAALAACGLLAASCETLNEDQCVAGDWGGIGYTDGANGHSPARFGDHVKACAKYNITPDQQVYMQGRERGLPVYCNPNRGFSEGRQGRTYGGVCPVSLERGFMAGYDDGRIVWDAQQRVDRAVSEINDGEYRARQADDSIRSAEAQLAVQGLSDDEKARIRERLKRLRDDRRDADRDASEARYRRDEAEREVNQLRYRFSPTYGSW
jgi:hypothetical protein